MESLSILLRLCNISMQPNQENCVFVAQSLVVHMYNFYNQICLDYQLGQLCPDQMPYYVVSDQGLHCTNIRNFSKTSG